MCSFFSKHTTQRKAIRRKCHYLLGEKITNTLIHTQLVHERLLSCAVNKTPEIKLFRRALAPGCNTRISPMEMMVVSSMSKPCFSSLYSTRLTWDVICLDTRNARPDLSKRGARQGRELRQKQLRRGKKRQMFCFVLPR